MCCVAATAAACLPACSPARLPAPTATRRCSTSPAFNYPCKAAVAQQQGMEGAEAAGAKSAVGYKLSTSGRRRLVRRGSGGLGAQGKEPP